MANIRTLLLLHDVAEAVERGKTILVAKHDRLNRLARYLDTKKRHMAQTGAGLLATGLLAGPIAAAVAAGGKALSFAGTSAVQGFRKWRKGKSYRAFQQEASAAPGSTGEAQWVRDAESGHIVYNKAYGEQVLADVRYLLAHQGLTDIYNAFANLDGDFRKLNQFSPGTFPPQSWHFGTFGAERDPATRPRSDAVTERGPTHLILIRSSDDAVKLWETVCRIQYRAQQVAEAVEVLQAFVEYVTAAISVYTASSVPDCRRLWQTIVPNEDVSAGDALGRLSRVTNEKGIRRHFGRRLISRDKDYRAWAYGILPDFIKAENPGLELALVQHTDERRYRQMMAQVVEKSAVKFVGIDPRKTDRDTLVGVLAKVAISCAGGMIKNSFKSQAQQKGLGEAALEGATKRFYQDVPGIKAAIEAVVAAAVEAANTAWNEYKLKTGTTLGLQGRRQQTIAERIGTLRTFAQEDIQGYVDIIEDWGAAHEKMTQGGGPDAAAEALLLFAKCERLYYGNRTGQMLEETVFAVNEIKTLADGFSEAALKAIDEFLTADREPYGDCAYYYGSAAKALADLGYRLVNPLLVNDAPKIAVARVNGPDFLEPEFVERLEHAGWIQTAPVGARAVGAQPVSA